jgi:hypothetical protein
MKRVIAAILGLVFVGCGDVGAIPDVNVAVTQDTPAATCDGFNLDCPTPITPTEKTEAIDPTIAFAIATIQDLPVCCAEKEGALVYLKDTLTFMTCNDNLWSEIDLKGKDGISIKGDTGNDGQSIIGPQGERGLQGISGQDGQSIIGEAGHDGRTMGIDPVNVNQYPEITTLCPYNNGIYLRTFWDDNKNGIKDIAEEYADAVSGNIDRVICFGQDGTDAPAVGFLTQTLAENNLEASCPSGHGSVIRTFWDANKNGTKGSTEIFNDLNTDGSFNTSNSSRIVCSGEQGLVGNTGEVGQTGSSGRIVFEQTCEGKYSQSSSQTIFNNLDFPDTLHPGYIYSRYQRTEYGDEIISMRIVIDYGNGQAEQIVENQIFSKLAAINNPYYTIGGSFGKHALIMDRMDLQNGHYTQGQITFAPYAEGSINDNKMFVYYADSTLVGVTFVSGNLTCTKASY